MWSHGAGSDVMKRFAAPMVGGVVMSFVLELLIYPVIFTIWKWRREVKPGLVHASELAARDYRFRRCAYRYGAVRTHGSPSRSTEKLSKETQLRGASQEARSLRLRALQELIGSRGRASDDSSPCG